MTIHWAMYRDTLVVDEALHQELLAEIEHHELATGTTMLLAARVVRHAKGYVLRLVGHPLVVVAERYDGNGGGIDTGGELGAAGAKGEPGTSWNFSHKGKSGGPVATASRRKGSAGLPPHPDHHRRQGRPAARPGRQGRRRRDGRQRRQGRPGQAGRVRQVPRYPARQRRRRWRRSQRWQWWSGRSGHVPGAPHRGTRRARWSRRQGRAWRSCRLRRQGRLRG